MGRLLMLFGFEFPAASFLGMKGQQVKQKPRLSHSIVSLRLPMLEGRWERA